MAQFNAPGNPISLQPLQPVEASSTPSRNSGGTAHILPEERARASFDAELMTNILDGGADRTKRRRFIVGAGEGMGVPNKYNQDRNQVMKEHIHHFTKLHEDYMGTFKPTRDDFAWMSESAMLAGSLMNSWGLAAPTIANLGSEEQVGWWLKRIAMNQITATYAQTELGHGSNVRGLQTTATYDRQTQEFVMDTPTLTAMKWWPGTLGKVATHAVVYAQLILDGKERGLHVFMVQIRDEHHRPLPGIELGDLGPKIGDAANDTGFMRMEGVRIPREYMLARYAEVTPEGEFKAKGKADKKVAYFTMLATRAGMVSSASGYLARAVTIGIRYSCVRRQGFSDMTSRSFRAAETCIMDYQVQRYRLFKQLALAYALRFCGQYMSAKVKSLEGDKATGALVDTRELPEIAATSAGLKGYCTYLTAQGIEDCRKCCGGNGYLLSSGVAQLASDYVWQTTAEGDFILLMLLSARFLIKCLSKARSGGQLSEVTDYLSVVADDSFTLKSAKPRPSESASDFLNLDYLLHLFKFRALSAVLNVGTRLQNQVASGKSMGVAWNSCALELTKAVVCHSALFTLSRFVIAVKNVQDKSCRVALKRVCALYAVTQILDENWAGILSAPSMVHANDACTELLDLMRPDAVAYVDAFDIPDRVLNSTIGRKDGNVYEALYEAAQKSLLNQQDPFVGYDDVLRPQLDIEFLKLRNGKIPSKL